MDEHGIEEQLKTQEDGKWGIEEVLSTDIVIVSRLTALETHHSVNHVIKRDTVILTITCIIVI